MPHDLTLSIGVDMAPVQAAGSDRIIQSNKATQSAAMRHETKHSPIKRAAIVLAYRS